MVTKTIDKPMHLLKDKNYADTCIANTCIVNTFLLSNVYICNSIYNSNITCYINVVYFMINIYTFMALVILRGNRAHILNKYGGKSKKI